MVSACCAPMVCVYETGGPMMSHSSMYVISDSTYCYILMNFPFSCGPGTFVQDWISALKVG